MQGKTIKNKSPFSLFKDGNTALILCLVTVLATLLIPLPTFILDLLLACSISLAVVVLMITLSARESLDMSTFPSLLLFVTLFRLSLNVASTRLILINGSAGKIIQTFGEFVAGGSFVVGLVIFLILVIIQFIVITKGAERISEVTARFTLDAMPGKQMAIDADLNAGAITEQQANERRAKVVKESEFYGAMDGASKFIRGDAKAGLIITAINIIGGIAMGYSKGMPIASALKTYSVLSIGDGLVSQIPSIVISISSGFLVTKISSSESVGQDFTKQFFRSGQPLMVAAAIICAVGFVPGLPVVPFFALAAGVAFTGYHISRKEQQENETENLDPEKVTKGEKQPVEELLDIDRVSVHVGVRLIGMVDPRRDSTIFDRIGALRRRFAQSMGIIIPLVRLKDNVDIEPNEYEIRIFDHPVAKGRLEPDMFLAMDSGVVVNKVAGIETKEPVYGLPALWITEDKKEDAELSGYTVIDPESVFITHLSETLRKHADELLTREDVQGLVDRLRKQQPSLVGDVIGDLVSLGLLQRVLRNLLTAGIPIKQMATIIETLGENAAKTKNPEILTEMVRKSLARTITDIFKASDGKISAITLDPAMENSLLAALSQENGMLNLNIGPDIAMALTRKVAESWKKIMDAGKEKAVLLCDSRLRLSLAGLLTKSVPPLAVLAYDEIVAGAEVEPLDTIKLDPNELNAPDNNELVQAAG